MTSFSMVTTDFLVNELLWYSYTNRDIAVIFHYLVVHWIVSDTNHTSRSKMMGTELFIDRRWLNDEDMTSGVQIIELKSSNSDISLDRDKDYRENTQLHSYDHCTPGGVNTTARQKRRLKNQTQNPNQFEDKNINYNVFDSTYDNDNFYGEFYASGSNNKDENIMVNHQMNCFTILDKNYAMFSENSSEEEFGNIEVVNCDNLPPDYTLNNYMCDADLAPYDTDADGEKRMVWIYSFKNKSLLTENEIELVNMPSQDLSTGHASIEHLPELNNLHKNVNRVATPIPPTFVPRLNITMTSTLPTVTEVTETSEQKSSSEEILNNIEMNRKPLNNWFYSENVTPTNKVNCTDVEKSNNVVDWMALSPRENKRRFKSNSWGDTPCNSRFSIPRQGNLSEENLKFENTNPFSDGYLHMNINQIPKPTGKENTDKLKQNNETISLKPDTPKLNTDTTLLRTNAPIQNMSSQVTDTPKHTSIHKTDLFAHNIVSPKRKIDEFSQKSGPSKPKTCTPTKRTGSGDKCKTDNVVPNITVRSQSLIPPASASTRRELHYSKITTIDIGCDQQDTPEDRGDFKRPQTRRPQIQIRPRPVRGTAISYPIENLNSNDWIIEKSLEVGNENREETDWPKEHGDGTIGNVIFMKHRYLFKPAEWEAYLPITESIPTLSLSVLTDPENASQSWLKRFKKIFCCK